MKPDAVLKSFEFDTPDSGSYFVNLSDSRVVAWDPLKWFEILGLTEGDEERSDLPSLDPIDILEPPYPPQVFLPRLHHFCSLILVSDDQELPSAQPRTGRGSLQDLL